MADRVMTWHVPGVLSETGVVGSGRRESYVADRDYRPDQVHLTVQGAVDGNPLIVDINDDGTSIFSLRPMLGQGLTTADWDDFVGDTIEEDSVITLDIDQVSPTQPGTGLTVELWLEEV